VPTDADLVLDRTFHALADASRRSNFLNTDAEWADLELENRLVSVSLTTIEFFAGRPAR
jgi:hypothetical protein